MDLVPGSPGVYTHGDGVRYDAVVIESYGHHALVSCGLGSLTARVVALGQPGAADVLPPYFEPDGLLVGVVEPVPEPEQPGKRARGALPWKR